MAVLRGNYVCKARLARDGSTAVVCWHLAYSHDIKEIAWVAWARTPPLFLYEDTSHNFTADFAAGTILHIMVQNSLNVTFKHFFYFPVAAVTSFPSSLPSPVFWKPLVPLPVWALCHYQPYLWVCLLFLLVCILTIMFSQHFKGVLISALHCGKVRQWLSILVFSLINICKLFI